MVLLVLLAALALAGTLASLVAAALGGSNRAWSEGCLYCIFVERGVDEMTTSAITPMIAAAPMATHTQTHGKSFVDGEDGGVSGGGDSDGGEGASTATERMDDVSIVAAAPNTSAEASASSASC